MNEVLSAKSWMYFAKSPSKIVKKPRWLFSKGTQWATCSVPIASDAFVSLLSLGPPASFKAKPRRRDLMDMYVSKGPCKVLPVKPAARAHALTS